MTEFLTNGKAELLLSAVLMGVGYLLKNNTPWLKSKDYIPWILVLLGAVTYPFIMDYSNTVLNVEHPFIVCALIGGAIGLSTSKIYDTVFKRDEKTTPPPAGSPNP